MQEDIIQQKVKRATDIVLQIRDLYEELGTLVGGGVDEVVEEKPTRKKRQEKENKMQESEKPMVTARKFEKRWSSKSEACLSCGTKSVPHLARGFCRVCYHKQPKKEMSGNPTPTATKTTEEANDGDVHCGDCGRKFRLTGPLIDATCPDCESNNVYPNPRV